MTCDFLLKSLREYIDGTRNLEWIDEEMKKMDRIVRNLDYRDPRIFRMWDKIKTGERTVDQTMKKLNDIHEKEMREQEERHVLRRQEVEFRKKFNKVNNRRE